MKTEDLIRMKNNGGYLLSYPYGNNKFTIKLRDLIENEGFEMFSDDYPLKEAYKDVFEDLFIQTYYMQEIGVPSIDEFKRQVYLDLKRYGTLYSRLLDTYELALANDPLNNQKLSTSIVINTLSGGTSSNKFNDAPKGKITSIADGYLSSLGETDTSANSDTTSETVFEGFTEAQINLIANYQSKLRNIMQELVDKFAPNFMQVLTVDF